MMSIQYLNIGFYCSMVTNLILGPDRFQDFDPGHFPGHLFLSFFENLDRLSQAFYHFSEIVGYPL